MPTRRLSGTATAASEPDNGGDNSGGGGSAGAYVDDVFSTYLWSNSSLNTDERAINGVNLADNGGMIWLKNRSVVGNNTLFDSERGLNYGMYADGADPQWDTTSFGFTAPTFLEDGYTTGTASVYTNPGTHVGWTWRIAPKFFDVVTYTGDGVAGLEIPHSLGIAPGIIIVKSIDEAYSWNVYSRGMGATKFLRLNTPQPLTEDPEAWNDTEPTSTAFTLGDDAACNAVGKRFIAYLFAHDDSDDSMIKCGGYTGNQTAGKEVDLGFEPQFVLIKAASGTGEWYMFDTMRGIVTGGFDPFLRANMSAVESASSEQLEVNPTGFSLSADINVNTSGREYIYMAIRRPNKPAEEFEPEELFGISPRTASPEKYPYVSNFPVDMGMSRNVTGSTEMRIGSRMTGDKYLQTENNSAEAKDEAWGWWGDMRSAGLGNTLKDDPPYVGWMWRRAPHFMDVVAYEGSGEVFPVVPHNLGVVPEMMWIKNRDYSQQWAVYHKDVSAEAPHFEMVLNDSVPLANASTTYAPFAGIPTATDMLLKDGHGSSKVGDNHIAYLFASVAGISKVGSYTGNGSEVEVDCGFTTGARWLLVKRVDSTGDWYFTSNPNSFTILSKLNTTEAQSNYMSTYNDIPAGFRVTSTSGNLCVDGAEYIFYAIA